MMQTRVWQTRILVSLMIYGSLMLMCAAAASSNKVSICPIESVADSIFGFRDRNCVVSGVDESPFFPGFTEGDEVSLQKALNLVQKNRHEYVALLFYASWCPFSRTFRPSFSILSSLYPSIPHFAIEESSIRPSILSKYGVHGFPTLFLFNSTMRVCYHGSRTLGSLVSFYSDVTGIKTASLDKESLDKIGRASHHEKHDAPEQESCPFSWARSPENLFREETYLALATTFVLLRLFYWTFTTMLAFAQFTWRRHMQNMRLESLLEHPRAYLNRAIQLFNSLNEPCKKSNLQEGALNARAWASKSLATVSIGDASTSRGPPVCECR
ncbi:PREDICTED: 5'-adenylylsulfate reductase-like 4 [Populus euphratica]|uniref:5'-adenylylsulfate reductase-like 4 n=1 Tax=Populus euphratica TaxID=75702 RepID=A0AAJ6T4Z9_POPEU|nr:PREDICTED: 5'-adenylylsulfate reductase-like 4 [Populus euphratica]